jgi:glutamate synthase (NADPH/NADH) small chain
VREFAISTKEFTGEKGKVKGLKTVQVEFKDGKLVEVPGTEKDLQGRPGAAGHGLCQPGGHRAGALWRREGRPRQRQGHHRLCAGGYATNVPKVFAAGDMRRGQSLVVWAIREGRQAARAVDEFLMGYSKRPAALTFALHS